MSPSFDKEAPSGRPPRGRADVRRADRPQQEARQLLQLPARGGIAEGELWDNREKIEDAAPEAGAAHQGGSIPESNESRSGDGDVEDQRGGDRAGGGAEPAQSLARGPWRLSGGDRQDVEGDLLPATVAASEQQSLASPSS